MKFGVGVRIEGKSGAIQGLQGLISSRVKVGNKNFLLIRWENGTESRVGTAAVKVFGEEVPNDQAVPVNQANQDLEDQDSDSNISEDESVSGTELSEIIWEADLGDQDGKISIFTYFIIYDK